MFIHGSPALTLAICFFSSQQFLILAQVCIGAAAAWHVWIYVGSGNANFVFFQTIAITSCIILLVIEVVSSVRRLQSVAPGVMVLIGDVHGEWE